MAPAWPSSGLPSARLFGCTARATVTSSRAAPPCLVLRMQRAWAAFQPLTLAGGSNYGSSTWHGVQGTTICPPPFESAELGGRGRGCVQGRADIHNMPLQHLEGSARDLRASANEEKSGILPLRVGRGEVKEPRPCRLVCGHLRARDVQKDAVKRLEIDDLYLRGAVKAETIRGR
jgi:hypothetical protein